MGEHIRIVDVSPRDGLQNEHARVPASVKIELIEQLAGAGIPVVEATSFVSAKWVPQLADAAEVMRGIHKREGVAYTALVPNKHGFDEALAAGVQEVAVFTAATESFARHNINCSIDESFERFAPVMEAAKAAGVKVRGYLSCALGCPYEGDVPTAQTVKVAERLYKLGCYEVSIGDTIGVGTPHKAVELFHALSGEIPRHALAAHFHDTYGQALANLYAVLELGVTTIDASVSGLGGCPYAPGATGNVATEDVIYMLDGMGVRTGIDMHKLIEAGEFICRALGRQSNSRAGRALAAKAARTKK